MDCIAEVVTVRVERLLWPNIFRADLPDRLTIQPRSAIIAAFA